MVSPGEMIPVMVDSSHQRHRREADDTKLQPRVEAQISHRDPAGMDAAANAHLPHCGMGMPGLVN